jgi:ubiquitin-protein ligase
MVPKTPSTLYVWPRVLLVTQLYTVPLLTKLSLSQGGHYKLLLVLPTDYPFKPPTINFQTKIYHPNVSNDEKGSMCVGMLKAGSWKPPNRILAVLEVVRNLLVEPNLDDAVEPSISAVYKNNPKDFEKLAKDWVKRYAGGT